MYFGLFIINSFDFYQLFIQQICQMNMLAPFKQVCNFVESAEKS